MKLRENKGIEVTEAIRKEFPAVFNHRPSTRCSEDYQLYRSDDLIERMADKGLRLVELAQQNARKRNPATQLHTMRFQPETFPAEFGINDSVPEIVIMNGHDGRNRFRAFAGIFRFICANGLVVASHELGAVVRRHYGKDNTFDKVSTIVAELPNAVNKMHSIILDWSALTLDQKAQIVLAAELIKQRGAPEWVTPELVLEARRPEEAPKDGVRSMWTTFNVLQENLTSTELHGNRPDQRASLRPIAGAWRSVAANSAIWTQAEAYYDAITSGLSPTEQEQLKKARRSVYDKTRNAVKAIKELETVD